MGEAEVRVDEAQMDLLECIQPAQLPTVGGLVDGVVSLDPPMLQCRGCGVIHTGQTGKLALLVITSNIHFHVGDGRTRRLCADCRAGCTCPTCRGRNQ